VGGRLETGIWFTDDDSALEELFPQRGSEVVLNCSVSTSSSPDHPDHAAGAPTANITWLRGSRPLQVVTSEQPTRRVKVRMRPSDGALVIRRVHGRTDNGFYQCAAAVEGLGTMLSRPTTLHVAGQSVL